MMILCSGCGEKATHTINYGFDSWPVCDTHWDSYIKDMELK